MRVGVVFASKGSHHHTMFVQVETSPFESAHGEGRCIGLAVESEAIDQGVRSHGLVLNPFRPLDPERSAEPIGVQLEVHAAASRLLTALRRSADADSFRPLWVEKSPVVSKYYHVAATAEVMALGGGAAEHGVLVAYVALPFMRHGRVRAALSTLAERATGPVLLQALAGYMSVALSEPDTGLPEYEALVVGDFDEMRLALAADPEAAVARTFGEYVGERPGHDDLMDLMKEAGARQATLEADPDASAEAAELEAGEALTASETSPVAGVRQEKDLNDADVVAEPNADDAYAGVVADYVISHVRAHLSPVVARALSAYRTSGASAMALELKITKAPRKTRKAVARFLHHGVGAIVIAFDQFDGWEQIPGDTRVAIAASFTEMRWAIDGAGIVVIMSSAGATRELEEQFGSAERVAWDMPHIEALNTPEASIADAPISEWLEAATIAQPAVSADDPVFEEIDRRTGGRLEQFATLAAIAVDDAIARGVDVLDPATIEGAPAADSSANLGPV